MFSSKEAERELFEKHSDSGAELSTPAPNGIWQITCPTCSTVHRTAERLCPLCTQKSFHSLQVSIHRLEEQNDRMREFIQEVRRELFKEWHKQAVEEKVKSPVSTVERRWSAFLKTTSY